MLWLWSLGTALGGAVSGTVRVQFIDDRPENPVNAGAEDWHGLVHSTPVFRSSTGRAFGGEVLLRMMPRGPQFGWISASVGRSFRTTTEERTPSDADVPVALVGVYGLGMPRGGAPRCWAS